MSIRRIVQIDEDKCDGCGLCVPACAEGAIEVANGKARLVSDVYCDGLGACLGNCPNEAITIIEREAAEFDVAAVETHLTEDGEGRGIHEEAAAQDSRAAAGAKACACPGAQVMQFEDPGAACCAIETQRVDSRLRQWPVQLALASPAAPYFARADLLVCADCVPFAYGDFHRDLLDGKAIVVACPKLDDPLAHMERLTEILRTADVNSVTVAHMEVPCCFGLNYMVRQAVLASGRAIPVEETTIGIRGERS